MPELEYLGCPVEAKVSFQDVVVMHIRDQTLTEARFGVTSARFTLCHEIAHVLLHRRTMNKRLSGAALPRGMNHSSSSFQIHETNADMEREANLFAGALLIPLEAISVKADPNALAKEYGTSPIAAREARLKALEVWWLIEELRNGE
ncbi:MAG: ImmA/IrrE family metallo-endopeptidase [Pseudomonadota bacterium]